MTHTAKETASSHWQSDAPPHPGRTHPGATTMFQDPRRGEARFGVAGLAVHSPVFGQAIDASGGGLRIESLAPLVAGGRYVFRLNYGARFLNLPGRVVWCRLDRWEATPQGPKAVFHAGIELTPDRTRAPWRSALAERAGVSLGA